MREQGYTYAHIAKTLGVTRQAAHSLCRDRKRPGPVVKEDDRAYVRTLSERVEAAESVYYSVLRERDVMMRRLYAEGWSGPRIASAFGLNYATVWRALHRKGDDE